MTANRIWQAVADAAERLGVRAVEERGARLADDLVMAFPEIAVSGEAGRVVLQAPGLRQRAFGSRRRSPDPRLAGLATGDGR